MNSPCGTTKENSGVGDDKPTGEDCVNKNEEQTV